MGRRSLLQATCSRGPPAYVLTLLIEINLPPASGRVWQARRSLARLLREAARRCSRVGPADGGD